MERKNKKNKENKPFIDYNEYSFWHIFIYLFKRVFKRDEGGLHMQRHRRRNTPAFTVLAYFTFIAGVSMFCIGLYNADNLQLNEKGYYIAVMILVAVGAILTQKVTRDNAEDDELIAEQERKYTKAE